MQILRRRTREAVTGNRLPCNLSLTGAAGDHRPSAWATASRAAALLFSLAVFAPVYGCAPEVVIPTLIALEDGTYDDEQEEGVIIFLGFMGLVEPCEFTIDILFPGDVHEYRHVDGSLPPGYGIVTERKVSEDSSTVSAVGRLRGPPVTAGSWTSTIAAVRGDGKELSKRALSLSCGGNT